MPEFDVRSLDPTVPAPPLVVDRNPKADIVGHGRLLPLVGNVRHYQFDVILPGGQKRVYADRVEDILAAFMPGYGSHWAQLQHLTEQLNNDPADADEIRTRITDCHLALFMARAAYLSDQRCRLQREVNEEAAASGSWDRLDSEEQRHLTEAADGAIPTGVPALFPYIDADGHPSEYVQGVWETPHVPLVIDRGDYGLFSEQGVAEPISEMLTFDEFNPDGFVVITDTPPNMIVLDATDDEACLKSLAQPHVEHLTITVYAPDREDDFYLAAVRQGREEMELMGDDVSDWVGYGEAEMEVLIDDPDEAVYYPAGADPDGPGHHHGDGHHAHDHDDDGWHHHGDGVMHRH